MSMTLFIAEGNANITSYAVGYDGSDCWTPCGSGGSCSWCGQSGYCCSANPAKAHLNGDCESSHLEPLTDYWVESGNSGHICSVPGILSYILKQTFTILRLL